MTTTRRQLWVLVLLTLVWGLNWPVMKLGVSGPPSAPQPFPPLTFRALSMLLGLPVLGAALLLLRVPFFVPRRHWAELARLALPNMIIWNAVIIVALQSLSSGRAAILGYSMPIFSALLGRLVFGDRLSAAQGLGVAAAALGIVLLLVHEFGRLAGAPLAALSVLGAAAVWAYGTQRLRRSTLPVPLLTIVFWMSVLATVALGILAAVLERSPWPSPLPATAAWGVAYNAVLVFGFSYAAWFYLARTLPPVASSISVMMIPVLGTFSGALWLGETLHWQDFVAVALVVLAIAAVLIKPAATPLPAQAP